MIAITNDNGLTLYLSPDTNLVTELNTGWLNDDELPGEFSYPIDVPLNDNNKRFVSYGYRVDGALPKGSIPVTLAVQGVLFRRCTFRYRINSGKLSGNLIIDNSEYYDKIRAMTLQQALTDRVALGDGLASNPPVSLFIRLAQLAALPPGKFPCTFFPIRNEAAFENGLEEKIDGFVRRIYLNEWRHYLDGTSGFSLDFPNKTDNSDPLLTDRSRTGNLICPQFYLSDILSRLMKLAGYTIESDWLADEEVQPITILNLTAMSQRSSSLSDFVSGHVLTVGQFLPEMTVSDFLKAVKQFFCLNFSFDSARRICRIAAYEPTVQQGSRADLTRFQSGPYSTEPAADQGFTLEEYIDGADRMFRDQNGNQLPAIKQVLGAGGTSVSMKAGTTQLSYEPSQAGVVVVGGQTAFSGAYWFTPCVLQPVNLLDPVYKDASGYVQASSLTNSTSTNAGSLPNNFGLRFLYYRGMSPDSKGYVYPFATSDVRDSRQNIVGKTALTLGGRRGLWASRLRTYYHFRDMTQKVVQSVLLPVSVLAGLERDRLLSLSLDDQVRRSYLPAKIQSDLPGVDGRTMTRLECWTIPTGLDLPPVDNKPLVWIELLQQPETEFPVKVSNRYAERRTRLTIRCWNDASRTIAALMNNLEVIVRVRKRNLETDLLMEEYLKTYLANGTSMVLENSILDRQVDFSDQGYANSHNLVYSLAIGNDYNILI